jgi:GntP family gluconate:H+ symporter
MGFSAATLSFHPVYLACAIGAGSLIGDWMNNSGFWVFAKMSGLTTEETLKSWTILTASLGITGVVVTVVLSLVIPLS